MKLKLRGHHLLCLKGFQGYGYNENFTKNMIKINNKRKDNSTIVTLINSPDDICLSCPNLKNNLCKNEDVNERIVKMDNEVLNHLNQEQDYNSVELFEKIDEIFNTKESISKICLNCIWHEKCLFYQNILKNR